MAAIPEGVDTGQQPPMTVPLRHFLVGLGFLLGGIFLGAGMAIDTVPGLGSLAHVHLLLVGWVCVTIMGAMTQFVPVWSGVTLHSQRIANAQLAAVVGGLLVFVIGLMSTELLLLVPGGLLMLGGFWVFAYNIGRTLAKVDTLDVTERHFAVALGFFLLLTALGVVLATNYQWSVLNRGRFGHSNVLGAHATLAVFGAVLTTIYGALYQLGTMFTQTELHGIDHHLQTIEEIGYPAGVLLLAAGRLFDIVVLAQSGAVLVLAGSLAVGVILLRKLWEMQVEQTPMHTRYAVVAVSLPAWVLLTLPAWLQEPTSSMTLLGPDGAVYVLLVGVIGFVVVGSLYHIIPFIVWVHRYSDKLGFEDVPMVDDLYDDRLAAVDGSLLLAGTVALVASEILVEHTAVAIAGGLLLTLGVCAFVTNMLLVLYRHSAHSFRRILFGKLLPWSRGSDAKPETAANAKPEKAQNRSSRNQD